MRGGSFCGSDHVAILWEEAGRVAIGREDDGGCLNLSTVGGDSISVVVVIRFGRCHGGICLQIYISLAQHPLKELRHEFVGP